MTVSTSTRLLPMLLPTEYASFRGDVLSELCGHVECLKTSLRRSVVLLDPMAGTAPLIPFVEFIGSTGYFNDLNTLHLFVNRARTVAAYKAFNAVGPDSLLQALMKATASLSRLQRRPTDKWIDEQTLPRLLAAWHRLADFQPSPTYLLRALFLLSIRSFASYTTSSNPTWLKPGGLRSGAPRREVFNRALSKLQRYYSAAQRYYFPAYENQTSAKGGRVVLSNVDAASYRTKTPVDIIVTSPPFCNRVDWRRLYGPEGYFLEALGLCPKHEYLGTTAVRGYDDSESRLLALTDISPYLGRFLIEVRKTQIHGERSSDYYVKYFVRYFDGLFTAFDQAISNLRRGHGRFLFVVQDNAHRGQGIRIHTALTEYFSCRGFTVSSGGKERPRHHLGLRNVSRKHPMVSPRQTESIWLAER